MNFYAGTLGQLVIVELFVLWIWLKVLFETVRNRESTIAHRKLLLTSLGLVLNAAAITGIMGFRIYELVTDHWPFVPGVVSFFVMLAVGNFLFIVAACIGGNTKLLRAFFVVTIVWTAIVAALSYYN